MRKRTLESKRVEAQTIIDRYPQDVAFSPEDRARLSELTGTELRYCVKRANPLFSGDKRHLYVLAYDWQIPEQWSWNNALRFAHSDDPAAAKQKHQFQKYLLALRYAIRSDLQSFLMMERDTPCACGSLNDLTADHASPPFISIAEAFLAEHPVLELRQLKGVSDVLADRAIESEWIAFHRARATFQVLCRRCNSSKGARV